MKSLSPAQWISILTAVGIAAIGAGIKVTWQMITFFSRMNVTVLATAKAVESMRDNHLVHIYTRLGRMEEALEIREDTASYRRGSFEDQGPCRLDADESSLIDGGDNGGLEDGPGIGPSIL